jgi:nucleotide-binding universal stress UspA family protein
VVGVDGSQGSARALAWALREARDRQVPLRIITAWAWDATASPSTILRRARQTQDALVRAVVADFPGILPDLCPELVEGDPASALIDRSEDGDLLVLGNHGLDGTGAGPSGVGTVADTCLRHCMCPVVVVPEDDPPCGRNGSIPGPGRRRGLAPAATAALGLL